MTSPFIRIRLTFSPGEPYAVEGGFVAGYSVTADAPQLKNGKVPHEELRLQTSGVLCGLDLRSLVDPHAPRLPEAQLAACPFAESLLRLKGGSAEDDTEPQSAILVVGQGLYRALPDSVRGLLARAEAELADTLQYLIRVELEFAKSVPELALLPWEFLHNEKQFLFQHLEYSLVRLPISGPRRKLSLPSPFKMLIWASNPPRTRRIDYQTEIDAIERRLKEKLGDRVEIYVKRFGGLEKLEDELDKGYHIFHYIGHGKAEAGGKLAFQVSELAEAHWVEAGQVAAALRNKPSLQLVVLNTCEAAQGALENVYSSLAARLAEQVPAVVAMQYPIADTAAIAFADEFYQTLAKGASLDECMIQGRNGLIIVKTERALEWGVPCLVSYVLEDNVALLDTSESAVSVSTYVSSTCTLAVPRARKVATQTTASVGEWVPDEQEEIYYWEEVQRTYRNALDEPRSGFISTQVVPPELVDPRVVYRRFSRPDRQSLQLWSLCETSSQLILSRRLLLLGEAGIGKTTLLKSLARRYAEAALAQSDTGGEADRMPRAVTLIPVVVNLSAWADTPDNQRTLLDYMLGFLREPSNAIEYPAATYLLRHDNLRRYLDDKEQQGRLLFLLDDYNRLPRHDEEDYKRRIAEIVRFCTKHERAIIVVASRSLDYAGELDRCRPAFDLVQLPPWDEIQITEFVRRNARDLLRYTAHKTFLSLADVPYQLTQLIDVGRELSTRFGDLLESTKAVAELKDAFVSRLLASIQARDGEDPALVGRVRNLLALLAGGLLSHNKQGNYVSYAEGASYVAAGSDPQETARLFRAAANTTILDASLQMYQIGFGRLQLEEYFAQLALQSLAASTTPSASPTALEATTQLLQTPSSDAVIHGARSLVNTGRTQSNVA